MKIRRFSILLLLIVLVTTIVGCGKQKDFDIKIVVPAGSQGEFVYSHEEISPLKDKIILSNGEGLGDTEVVLTSADPEEKTGYKPEYMTSGMPVEFEVEKGAWYKIGVNIQNPTDEDIVVYVHVKDVEVRVE